MYAESANRKQRFPWGWKQAIIYELKSLLVVEGEIYGTLVENLLSIKVFAPSTRK